MAEQKVMTVADVRAMLRGTSGNEPHSQTQLTPLAPFPGYDSQSVADITARIANMNDRDRAIVRLYEAATKNRKSVLEALG